MKKSYFFAIGIALAIAAYSQSNFAGFISDSYNTGDTLTAATLDTIKTAVNDNDTMIAAQFHGDGSAGDVFINLDTDWSTNPPANPYFTNITIASGVTLTVPAGTTIRCSGSLTNQGTILVLPGAAIGNTGSIPLANNSGGLQASAHPGDTTRPASAGEFYDVVALGIDLVSGNPGSAIPETVAMTSFGSFKFGGGSGGGYTNAGGQGGGLLKVYADVGINNIGSIDARGADATNDGNGGGGGGIVILAARRGIVDNTSGTIDVSGGDGSGRTSYSGNGGGGGGGIVVMVSPTAPVTGSVTFTGGTGATGIINLTAGIRIAGGGGGGSGGQGGVGGVVNGTTGVPSPGLDGADGYVINLALDPGALAR